MTLDELDALHALLGPLSAEAVCDEGVYAASIREVDPDEYYAEDGDPNDAAHFQAEQAAECGVKILNAWPAISARLRAAEAEVERLRGEVAGLALLINPQAARDAAATERDNRAALAILTLGLGGDLIDAARTAMAMTELYRAMWRRNEGVVGLAGQALHVGLAECERLRSEGAELRGLVRWFLDGDDHTHEDDCGARGNHDLDVCRNEASQCHNMCEGPHCTCDATEMRDRARAALGEP